MRVFSIAYAEVFGWGALATGLGLLAGALFVRQNLILITTGLTAIFLIPEMNALLTENRDAIWLHRRSSWEANSLLFLKVLAIFAAICLVTILSQCLAPSFFYLPTEHAGPLFSNEAMPLFLHNLRVLMICVLLAFAYRSAGVMLVVTWNAVNWSLSIFTFLNTAHQAGASHAWFYSLAVLPHLIFEAFAYVTAGMSGVFLSKALFKYRLSSAKFFRVSRACVTILVVSVACLWLAMELEIGLAQSVLHQLQK